MEQQPAPVASFASWYEAGPYGAFVRESRLPTSSRTRLFRVRQPPGSYPDRPLDEFSLALALEATGPDFVDLGGSRGWNTGHRGIVTVAPPDTAVTYETTSGIEFIAVNLPGPVAREVLDEVGAGRSDFGPVHEHGGLRDPGLRSLIERLWAEGAQGEPMGALIADELSLAIAVRLGRLSTPALSHRTTVPLGGPKLRRVLDRIEDGLADELRLADLAEVAELSVWHFARASQAATGLPPHRWLLLKRLSRAKRLIVGTSEPLAEVAAACGFSSQSHLTAAFRQATGTTPARLRRDAAGASG